MHRRLAFAGAGLRRQACRHGAAPRARTCSAASRHGAPPPVAARQLPGLVVVLTRSVVGRRQSRGDSNPVPFGADRPLAITGAIAACAAAGTGLAVLTMLALIGWIAAPHAGLGLTGVLRTAALLWLIGHHVGFALPGAGRIGMLPLGLVLLPGALLWRAGRWVVRAGGVSRLRHVGYAALALAVPYAMVAAALALASSSSHGRALALRGGGVPVPASADGRRPRRRPCPRLVATAGRPAPRPASLADRWNGRGAGGRRRGRRPDRRFLARPAPGGVPGRRRDPGSRRGGIGAAAARPARLRAERRRLGDLVHARPRVRVRHRDGDRADGLRARAAAGVPDARGPAVRDALRGAAVAVGSRACRARTWPGPSAGC